MSDSTPPEQATYEIRVKGHLSPRLARQFEGLHVDDGFQDDEPVSILSGPITDQSALHGVLTRIRDLGMEIVSVNQIGPDAGQPGPEH